jgi:hypothetical protein
MTLTVALVGFAPTTIVLSVHGEQHRTRRQDDSDRLQHRCYSPTIGRDK